jgi:hypothetical protein
MAGLAEEWKNSWFPSSLDGVRFESKELVVGIKLGLVEGLDVGR